MRFWTVKQTTEWLGLHDVRCDSTDHPIIDESWKAEQFALPKDAYSQAEFSRTNVNQISPFAGGIFWLKEWNIFPLESNPILIEKVRLCYGETRSLSSAPTFVFDTAEKQELIALFRVFVMFGWDGYLFSNLTDFALVLRGHEGFAEVCRRRLR